MRSLVICLVAALATSCAKKTHDTWSVSDAFNQKNDIYLTLQHDWDDNNCDWLLWRSLQDAVRRQTGVVETAEGSPGKWYRTPGKDQRCFVNGKDTGSASTISRDMILGLGVYLWQTGDGQKAGEVIAYVDAHQGNMGEGDPFRIDMRPGLYSTFYAIKNLAANANFPLPPRVEDPDPEAPAGVQLTAGVLADLFTQTDYQAHLTVLHAFLRGLVYGALTDLEVKTIKSQVDRQPRNAFYQAVYHRFTDGDQTTATRLLMDESFFPADALPTSANYCTDYLWQRDDGTANWTPCPDEAKTHTGADWLVAAAVVRNGFRQK